MPILPINLSTIDFENVEYKEYTLSNEGKIFLRFDNKNNNHIIIVWMSDSAIEWLRESLRNHWDGTFASAPKFFFQFYVIFGQKIDMILPCSYCVLPDKTTSTYDEVLESIKVIVEPLGISLAY